VANDDLTADLDLAFDGAEDILHSWRKGMRPYRVSPAPHSFLAAVNAALVERILHISERTYKADIHHHCETNDLRAAVNALEQVSLCHEPTL
jgi:hypothetical protein